MIALNSTVELSHHHIQLNKDFLSDLAWWSVFASHWNGTSLILGSHNKDIFLASDAKEMPWAVVPGMEQNGFRYNGKQNPKTFQLP